MTYTADGPTDIPYADNRGTSAALVSRWLEVTKIYPDSEADAPAMN